MSQHVRRLAGDSVSSYLRYGVTIVVQLALVPYMVGQLGDTGYGLWTLTFSVLGFLSLVDFGFTTSVVRFTAEARGSGDAERRNRMLSTVLVVYLVLAAAATLVMAGFSPFYVDLMGLPPETRAAALPLLWVLAARSLAVSLPFGMFRAILYGNGRITVANILSAAGTLMYAGAAVIALELGTGIIGLAWGSLIAFFLEHLMYLVAAMRTTPGLRLSPRSFDPSMLRAALSVSAAQFLVQVSSIVLLRTDPIIVNAFLPLSAVTMYGVALKVAENILMLIKQGVNVLGPLAAELSGAGEEAKVRTLLVKGARFSLAPAAAVMTVTLVLGTDALSWWVGPSFAEAGAVLSILMVSVTLLVPQMVASGVFSMTGRHKLTAWAAVLSMIVNLVASISLAPWLGLEGVAIGTLVATVLIDVGFVMVLAGGAFGVPMSMWVGQVFGPAMVPAALSGAALFGLRALWRPESLVAVGAEAMVGLALYAVIFVRFGMSADERAMAWSIARGRGDRP